MTDRDKPWVMRTYAGHSTPAKSNELYRTNLAKGQTGLFGTSGPTTISRCVLRPRAARSWRRTACLPAQVPRPEVRVLGASGGAGQAYGSAWTARTTSARAPGELTRGFSPAAAVLVLDAASGS